MVWYISARRCFSPDRSFSFLSLTKGSTHTSLLLPLVPRLTLSPILSSHPIVIRLALVEPTTFKVQHEYSWEGPRVEATLKEDTKTFTLVSVCYLVFLSILFSLAIIYSTYYLVNLHSPQDTKMRQFDEESGNTKQLVDLVQYLSAKGKI